MRRWTPSSFGDRRRGKSPANTFVATKDPTILRYVAHIKGRGQEERERKRNPRFKARRWVVERSNRWHNLFRRLKIRYEVHADNYLGFVQLANARSEEHTSELQSRY